MWFIKRISTLLIVVLKPYRSMYYFFWKTLKRV